MDIVYNKGGVEGQMPVLLMGERLVVYGFWGKGRKNGVGEAELANAVCKLVMLFLPNCRFALEYVEKAKNKCIFLAVKGAVKKEIRKFVLGRTDMLVWIRVKVENRHEEVQ